MKKTTKQTNSDTAPDSITGKSKIITKYQLHDKDTGSPAVQIGLLSERIAKLQEHFKSHKKDNSSRRGLLKIVGQRRRLIEYLKSSDPKTYTKVKKSIEV